MVEFPRKFESHGLKIGRVNSFLMTKSINLIKFCSVGVRCDSGRFSVHGPFIEKLMKQVVKYNQMICYCIESAQSIYREVNEATGKI